MRIGRLILCVAMLAGCSRISGTSPLPSNSSNLGMAPAGSATSGRYLSLYSFRGRTSGGWPHAGLVAYKGSLYGTTTSFGRGYGTVFAINPFGKLRVLYQFRGYPDGAYPLAGLIWFKGALYGTTSEGGTHNNGTIFAVATTGFERVVHSFGKPPDGAAPEAGMIAEGGVLYGTTHDGGNRAKGTVFAFNTQTEQVIHSFSGAPGDGGHPSAGLIALNGVLYGTTRAGGQTSAGGTVYKITPFGKERVIHSFGVRAGDGANPAGPLVEVNGELFGTTINGGNDNEGTVFATDTAGVEEVLHNFGFGNDGKYPQAGLIAVSDVLYGTTAGGGTYPKRSGTCFGYSTCGTIFKISEFGQERVLWRFQGFPDGANPQDALTDVNGALFGTTYWGGSGGSYGTVFRIFVR